MIHEGGYALGALVEVPDESKQRARALYSASSQGSSQEPADLP